uniref:Aurora kinase n=1 Tax=Steinernema glaseri TaxID=37863 RepID=A0A1I7Z5K3_9BILA
MGTREESTDDRGDAAPWERANPGNAGGTKAEALRKQRHVRTKHSNTISSVTSVDPTHGNSNRLGPFLGNRSQGLARRPSDLANQKTSNGPFTSIYIETETRTTRRNRVLRMPFLSLWRGDATPRMSGMPGHGKCLFTGGGPPVRVREQFLLDKDGDREVICSGEHSRVTGQQQRGSPSQLQEDNDTRTDDPDDGRNYEPAGLEDSIDVETPSTVSSPAALSGRQSAIWCGQEESSERGPAMMAVNNDNDENRNADHSEASQNAVKDDRKMWVLDDFEIGRSLGRGKFGTVFLARDRKSKFVVALKVITKKQIEKYSMVSQIGREVSIQYEMRHKNILRLYGYFHDKIRMYIVLEFAGRGNLFDVMKKLKKFPGNRAAFYISQVVSAVQYCHEKGVFHRDLKLENLLLTEKEVIKLADFGWSVQVDASDIRRSTTCGTLDYICPEMLDEKPHTHTVDNWSVGVLLYEFIAGHAPFAVEGAADTIQRIRDVQYDFTEEFEDGVKDIVSRLLVREPEKRMPLLEVLAHEWVVNGSKMYELELEMKRTHV